MYFSYSGGEGNSEYHTRVIPHLLHTLNQYYFSLYCILAHFWGSYQISYHGFDPFYVYTMVCNEYMCKDEAALCPLVNPHLGFVHPLLLALGVDMIHTYTFAYKHAYTHTNMYTYTYIHTDKHKKCIHTCIQTQMHIYVQPPSIHIFADICTYIRTHVQTYVHTHKHAYIPTNMFTHSVFKTSGSSCGLHFPLLFFILKRAYEPNPYISQLVTPLFIYTYVHTCAYTYIYTYVFALVHVC